MTSIVGVDVSRPLSPLTLAFENVKKVGNSLNKPQKFYLGKDFQALDHMPLPAESTTLAAAQARLKELVDSSENPDKERLEKTITTVLKMIFQPVSSSAKPKAELPDTKEKSSPTDDKSSDDEEIEKAKAKLMFFNSLLDLGSPPHEKEMRNIKNELSVLLVLSDVLYQNHRKAVIVDKFQRKSFELIHCNNDFVNASLADGELQFTLNPSTIEGMAFLCKWSKLLKTKDSYFCVGTVSELTPRYCNALRSIAATSTGEVKEMALFLIISMEWGILSNETEKAAIDLHNSLLRLVIAKKDPRTTQIVNLHCTWIDEFMTYQDTMQPTSLLDFSKKSERNLEIANKFLLEREKHLKVYRKRHQELQRLGAKHFKWKKEDFNQFFNCSIWRKGPLWIEQPKVFATPSELEAMPLSHEAILSFKAPSNADEKESSVKVDKKKRKKKKVAAGKGSPATQNTPPTTAPSSPKDLRTSETNSSHTPTQTASSSPKRPISHNSSSPSLNRTLFSLEESHEETDSDSDASRSSSPTLFSDFGAENSFSLLNLDSPIISSKKESTSPQVLDLSTPLGLTTSSSSGSLSAQGSHTSDLSPSSPSRSLSTYSPSVDNSPSSNARSLSAPSSPTPPVSLTQSHDSKKAETNPRPRTNSLSSSNAKPRHSHSSSAFIAKNPSTSGSFHSLSSRSDRRNSQSKQTPSSRPRAASSSSNMTSNGPNRPTSATIARPLTAPTPSRSQEPKADPKQMPASKPGSSLPRSAPLSPSSLTRSFSNKPSSLTSSMTARPLSDEQTPTRSEEASADSKVNVSYTASSSPEQPKRALPRTTSWGHLPSTLVPAIKKEPLDDEKQNKSTRDRILEGGMGAIDYDDRVKKQRKDDPGGLHDFPDIIDLFVGTKHSRKSPWFDDKTMRNQPLHEIFCQINTGDLPPEYVIIGYTFNEQSKKCYHRFAAKKSKIEFINAIVNQVKYQVANPTPSESTRLNQAPEEVSEQRNGQTFTFKVLSPHDIVFFKDEHGNEYRLFKMQ